ncbi:MAG TPA: molybdopterin-synthase adenylyltransferase MoeB [Opitutaceae bacterium]|nr:molybdopterin-synthase adenylyltransferase MoeB [Opitutaceae bacterium]
MPDAPPTLSPADLSRYSRHVLLDEVGVEGQRKLAAARVLVVGAGGLGSPAALYLAAAGVGTLGLADFDRVEEHNLQRQILHDTPAVGRPKVESAAQRLAALNPGVELRLHREGVTPANAVALFAGYDLIVDGADNFPTRYLNNDAACLTRRPLVYGSIFKFEGQVTVFDPAQGAPCYRCLFPEPPPAGSVPGCGEAGVFGALCGVIGSLQAMEAIKCLLGIGQSLRGRLLVYDALIQQFRLLNLKRDPGCPLCGREPRIRKIDAAAYDYSCAAPAGDDADEDPDSIAAEISVEEAHRLVQAGDGRVVLLDVREPYEVQICRIAGSEHIPLRAVPARLDSLPRDRRILVVCHHGDRSRRITEFLRARGFPAVSNVQGGIAAWTERIDPSLRRY